MPKNKAPKNAISPTREEDYPEWYQQVIKASDLAENSPARGCMVIKPWGWGIWENIQKILDKKIKDSGHENAYFPLFIPLEFLEREAAHVDGFAKECAVVTHHRLEAKDGKLVPAGKLEEPFVVRPTSETIIGDAFSRWVKSYRDLPLKINQWANVVRWEMRPRLFLRTAEFLWQEGHTVHTTEKEAREEVDFALEMYRELLEDHLAIPVIKGEKSQLERFPGAETTLCIEAMMQDRKALQAGTSHYLGTNFSKACNIRFLDENGDLQFGHTTSWGVSTRLVGGLIMAHSDDDGLRVPPKVAAKQIALLPVAPKEEMKEEVFSFTDKLEAELKKINYNGAPLSIAHDKRELRGGEKKWQWIKKGIPLIMEVGPRDIENSEVSLQKRNSLSERNNLAVSSLESEIPKILDSIQDDYFNSANSYQKEHTRDDISDFNELIEFFTPKNKNKPEIHGGFVLAHLSDDPEAEKTLHQHKLTVRCIPLSEKRNEGKCIVSGEKAEKRAIIAKAY